MGSPDGSMAVRGADPQNGERGAGFRLPSAVDRALGQKSTLDVWCSPYRAPDSASTPEDEEEQRRDIPRFDEYRAKGDALAELLFDPPAWTEAYYNRSADADPLDQITDTAFYARSHHVGLVQVVDVFAFVLRRFTELADYGAQEGYEGELDRLTGGSTS
jgi:hypothetical protein